MDKYEFSMRVEQLKKMAARGDYETAMKIADEIDWRRVPQISILTMVSEIYEKNNDIREAKEILLLAYDRAPVGKRILYKLAILSLEEGNIAEAETYYREFYDVAPEDPRQHILRYLILREKGAPMDQLIASLEQYNSVELNERWMYELAEVYYKAGRYDDCVRVCDEIMLMFGIGPYVDKAIALKTNRLGQPLTDYQRNLVSRNQAYNAAAQAQMMQEQSAAGRGYAPIQEHAPQQGFEPVPGYMPADNSASAEGDEYDDEIAAHMAMLDAEMNTEPAPATASAGSAPAAAGTGFASATAGTGFAPAAAAAESTPAAAAPVIEEEPYVRETPDVARAVMQEAAEQEDRLYQPETPQEQPPVYTVNFLVERRTPEAGFEAAKRLLKLMHEHTGSGNKVAKIPASKLNEIGVPASRSKLEEKDLIITEAGDLTPANVYGIMDLIGAEPEKRVIVMIDNPMQLNKLMTSFPELLQLFHLDKEDSTAAPRSTKAVDVTVPRAQSVPEERHAASPQSVPEEHYTASPQSVPEERYTSPQQNTPEPHYAAPQQSVPEERYTAPASREQMIPAAEPVRPERENSGEEMDIDEFAQEAAEYAKSIDCSISGKSMLALYERIEIMEEDGIPLTKENAAALIEEAADRAEKPPLGKKLAGLFSPKYDKEDRLILREEHFIP